MSHTPATSSDPVAPSCRVVLVDFDAQDADLLPELLCRPELSVRLVAGRHASEIGVRVAELCDLPATIDLGDLTRELFDLALVSERSPRRTQVEGLLLALGTPCVSPRAFLEGRADAEGPVPSVDASIALHAAAFESSLGGEALDGLLEQALEGDPAGTPSATLRPQPARGVRLDGFPSPEARAALERVLADVADRTGARTAELHAGDGTAPALVARVGDPDRLLDSLVTLALELDTPQVVRGVAGVAEGRSWGAWPFRTTRGRGVVAAAGVAPAAGDAWRQVVDDLRTAWDEGPSER